MPGWPSTHLLRRHAVTSGMGAHFLPTYEGDAVPELRRIGPVYFTRDLWLLTHPDLRDTRRVRVFVQHLSQKLTPTLSPGSSKK
jgi:DNA-binding transcriptional LysR family regulator